MYACMYLCNRVNIFAGGYWEIRVHNSVFILLKLGCTIFFWRLLNLINTKFHGGALSKCDINTLRAKKFIGEMKQKLCTLINNWRINLQNPKIYGGAVRKCKY